MRGAPPITKKNKFLLEHWVPRWTVKRNSIHLGISYKVAYKLAVNHGLEIKLERAPKEALA